MFWSPAGNQLLMPTYTDALVRFRDTDIRLFDPATFAVRNLTEDSFHGSLLNGKGHGNLDVLAHWIDDDTIAFVRYAIPDGGFKHGVSSSLMTIDVEGGDPRPALGISSSSKVAVWPIAVSADGRQIAYGVVDKDNAGIYVLKLGEATPQRVAAMSADSKPPTG